MKLIYTGLLLIATSLTFARSSASFDAMGNITTPDSKHLILGKKANEKGRTEHANKRFKKAALLGNEHAKILLANNYIKEQDYSTALVWLKLIDPNQLNAHGQINQAIRSLNLSLTSEQRQTSQLLLDQLQQNYNQSAAQKNRQNWRNQLQFTGTRLRGQVPHHLTVYPIENGLIGFNTITITDHEIRSQLDQYVNAYDHKLHKSQVTLAPIELNNN